MLQDWRLTIKGLGLLLGVFYSSAEVQPVYSTVLVYLAASEWNFYSWKEKNILNILSYFFTGW